MSEKLQTKISIIIPVKNGAKTIRDCLEGIFSQTLIHQTEVIIIDSGSTDGTLEMIEKFPVRLYQIAPEHFNHGATRNYGVSLAKGEFVVLTVQDAVPVGTQWLEIMLRHFKDPQVAAVCGQQIVPHHADKNPHKWFRPQNEPGISIIQRELMPADYIPRGWDDVNAMYRKDVLLKIPFRVLAFGEDFYWAFDAYYAGCKLVFDAHSKVEHYHHASPKYVYNLIVTELYYEYHRFNTTKSYPLQIKELALIVYRNFKYNASPKWIWHNWMILYTKNRAWKDVKRAIQTNSLEIFYDPFSKEIPQGQQSKIRQ